jgi:hypothetical protein
MSVAFGCDRSSREGATVKAARLVNWWATIEYLYADRVFAFGLAEARITGEMADRARC